MQVEQHCDSMDNNVKQEPQFEGGITCDYDHNNLNFAGAYPGNQILDHNRPIALGDTTHGTGIVIRTRPVSNQAVVQNSISHGNASKRIRLQKKFQVGTVECIIHNKPTQSGKFHEGESIQVRHPFCHWHVLHIPIHEFILILKNLMLPSQNDKLKNTSTPKQWKEATMDKVNNSVSSSSPGYINKVLTAIGLLLAVMLWQYYITQF